MLIGRALHRGSGKRPEVLNHGHAHSFDRCVRVSRFPVPLDKGNERKIPMRTSHGLKWEHKAYKLTHIDATQTTITSPPLATFAAVFIKKAGKRKRSERNKKGKI